MKLIIFLLFFCPVLHYAQPEVVFGGIARGDKSEKKLSLVFTSHEFIDGFETISAALKKHKVPGSFFFTGDFYRTDSFSTVIKSLLNDGHYLGAHSDKHILYCSWEKRDSLLVTKDQFFLDVMNNYAGMERFGIMKEDAPYFLPPYEWYNSLISEWTKELGLVLINFTPGTSSNQDWTIPEMGERYLGSDSIFNRVLRYEERDPNGLNGFILLVHFGTHPSRKDKFYRRLDELIDALKARGYSFVTLKELLG